MPEWLLRLLQGQDPYGYLSPEDQAMLTYGATTPASSIPGFGEGKSTYEKWAKTALPSLQASPAQLQQISPYSFSGAGMMTPAQRMQSHAQQPGDLARSLQSHGISYGSDNAGNLSAFQFKGQNYNTADAALAAARPQVPVSGQAPPILGQQKPQQGTWQAQGGTQPPQQLYAAGVQQPFTQQPKPYQPTAQTPAVKKAGGGAARAFPGLFGGF